MEIAINLYISKSIIGRHQGDKRIVLNNGTIPKNITVCFLILSTLVVSNCIVLFHNNADAQIYSSEDAYVVNQNSLESIVNQPETLDVSAQIDVGRGPIHIYGDLYEKDFLYVANSESDTVSVIDTTTNTVVATIPVGNNPTYIYGDLGFSDTIYVANRVSHTVSVIDTTTNTVVATIPVGNNPEYIYGNLEISDTIYVLSTMSTSVSAINTTTNTVKSITIEEHPNYIYGDLQYLNAIYITTRAHTVSVIDTTTNTVVATIPVGNNPTYIYGDPSSSDFIYVANSFSDTISVIDTTTNTVVATISLGGASPIHIYGDLDYAVRAIYVTTARGVSVINTTTNTVVATIPVGGNPHYIHDVGLSIYVTNSETHYIAVIDKATNTLERKIPVGYPPHHIFMDGFDAMYVANFGSNGVSLINYNTNDPVAGVTFDISPFRAGEVFCNTDSGNLDTPINRFLYVDSGTRCVAKPNKGFEFSSWIEILDRNASRTINASTTSASPWTALLDIFNLNSDDPAATLTVNRFGNFAAYFRALPPAIPSEYWIPLYGIIVSTVIGWSIPSIITWRKSKKQTTRLNSYHQEMASLYKDGRLDENDMQPLNKLNANIYNAYTAGKINNDHYTNLKNEISIAYEEIFKNTISSLELSNKDINRKTLVDKLKEDIKDAYSKGKITGLHYNLLIENVSKLGR